jgi:hypothetical protein
MDGGGSRYELHILAKGADGTFRPFDAVISDPERYPEFGWRCRVQGAAPPSKPMRTFGDDPDLAWAMAIGLIERLVEHANWSLVDEAENPVALPEVAKT